ncbi:CAAX amino terminal protease [Macleaya cordata]|uniref:CAAX amino terminal protease n=1 Tax=Macleaya cordata TaxID=56857 RepID=A0A200QSE0_MACCD|nr:CAAX amino terminal protease [Macleaya cordata]
MVAAMITSSPIQSSLLHFSSFPKLSASKLNQQAFLLRRRNPSFSPCFSLHKWEPVLRFPTGKRSTTVSERGLRSICFYSGKEDGKETGPDWPILERWDVPWKWQTVFLTMVACGLSFVLTGLVEAALVPYLGLQIGELSLDEKAEILFVDQAIATAVVLAVVYGLTNSFQPLPKDLFRYELKEPFSLQSGWLLWAGVGLGGAVAAIALTGAAMALFSSENPERETDALVRLLPLIGSSGTSTAFLVGITGVLAPLLEETVFRGFLMVSLTKWFPTPVSVLLTAAVFALAHLTPGQFPQLFVLVGTGCIKVQPGVKEKKKNSKRQSCVRQSGSRRSLLSIRGALELWGDLASHLSYAPRIRYQRIVAGILKEVQFQYLSGPRRCSYFAQQTGSRAADSSTSCITDLAGHGDCQNGSLISGDTVGCAW